MKRLIRASNASMVLYHVTKSKNVESILSSGLNCAIGDYIYLSEKPIQMYNDDVLLKVTVPDESRLNDWEDFWLDDDGNEIDMDHEYDPNNKYYMYEQSIGPEYIQRA